MAILNFKCFSISNTKIISSLVPKNTTSSHSIPKTPSSPPRLSIDMNPSSHSAASPQTKQHTKNSISKPSVAEIERAIGAGAFRDADIYRRTESDSFGGEWPAEKKLREVGEWLLETTENSPNGKSAGNKILKGMFLWILPVWILAFLVAARVIQLPFNSPFLDDLLL